MITRLKVPRRTRRGERLSYATPPEGIDCPYQMNGLCSPAVGCGGVNCACALGLEGFWADVGGFFSDAASKIGSALVKAGQLNLGIFAAPLAALAPQVRSFMVNQVGLPATDMARILQVQAIAGAAVATYVTAGAATPLLGTVVGGIVAAGAGGAAGGLLKTGGIGGLISGAEASSISAVGSAGQLILKDAAGNFVQGPGEWQDVLNKSTTGGQWIAKDAQNNILSIVKDAAGNVVTRAFASGGYEGVDSIPACTLIPLPPQVTATTGQAPAAPSPTPTPTAGTPTTTPKPAPFIGPQLPPGTTTGPQLPIEAKVGIASAGATPILAVAGVLLILMAMRRK